MSRLFATLFGIGHLRPGPGTWGSAAAVAIAWPIHALGSFPALFVATALVLVVGWWSVAEATRGTGNHDPSEIVIDEVVGQWIALWPLSAGLWHAGVTGWTFPWPGWVSAFVLFRIFDIWKPGPVGWADRRSDTAGTMIDDVVAGVMAGLCVGLLGWLAHGFLMQ
jgi:phosphatidylglycerophosphatase A